MTSKNINELQLDISDLNQLLQHAQRQKSKDVLSLEIRRLQSEMIKIKENEQNVTSTETQSNTPKPVKAKCYDVKINNHGWDQTNKFVKIYIPLSNVQSLPPESVVCNYTEKSLHFQCFGLENKNHELVINNLCEEIEPNNSSFKITKNYVVVSLAKKQSIKWAFLTEVEKRLKESKTAMPSTDKDEDPGLNLMNMMKKMYQDGDDEMKKTIAKVWTESQDKIAGDSATK